MIKHNAVFPALDESVHFSVLENGLRVYLVSKPSFKSSYAIFGTCYGSVDTRFAKNGGDFTDVPAGIAHFLEHKLFESEDGDAFSRFAETGASANAYTSFDRTCYLFSCADRFYDNLDILLDFVRHPYFTAKTVQKEQGIIGQEIRMYEDAPDWTLFVNLLECLYKAHPVKINIAGTVESIAEITDSLLYTCYETFYNPQNMFLCIAGNFDCDAVLSKIDKATETDSSCTVQKGQFEEPKEVVTKRVCRQMPVAMPLFALGIKDTPDLGLKSVMETQILLEALCGPASQLFTELTEKNRIGSSIGTEYFIGNGYAALMFDGESPDPDDTAALMLDYFKNVQRTGVPEDAFEGARRKIFGNAVKHFDSAEEIVSQLVDCAVHNYKPYEDLTFLQSITLQDVNRRLREIDFSNSAVSIILP
ncbi:MAG: insulinase family protein [Clostridia bacterium]|nr:insulinase family protein [Clostridia bacterium]